MPHEMSGTVSPGRLEGDPEARARWEAGGLESGGSRSDCSEKNVKVLNVETEQDHLEEGYRLQIGAC